MRSSVSCGTFVVLALALVVFFSAPAAQAVPAGTTTTTLTMASGSTAIASGGSVASGSQVNLTAAVLAGSTKVTAGQVSFCDATALSCTDIHLIGTAQLTGAGTATLAVRPGVGSHQYKAIFAPTPHTAAAYLGSASAASTVTVNGIHPAFSVLTYTDPSSPAYDLTAVVGGNALAAPTGMISFNDTNNSTVLATAPLAALPAGPDFLLSSFAPLIWANSDSFDSMPLVVGDFNGDGSPDLAGVATGGCDLGYCWFTAAGAAINDGNGNLFPLGSINLEDGFTVASIVAGDFNSDGKLDLAIGGTNGPSSIIDILLGNGDGTFTNKGDVSPGSITSQAFAVGDFNGDGIPDLAVANQTSNLVEIFLGQGDGTFKASTAATSSTGTRPSLISVADFNGDGIPDLAVGNGQVSDAGSVSILLGNGDGTFTAAASNATVSGIYSMAIADFDGDGKADIAVINGITLTMLKGKGDGTFTSSTITPSVGSFEATTVVTGDFNGDGKVDMAFAGYNYLLIGKGDGTFTPTPLTTVVPTYPASASFGITEAADFNGDGVTDLIGPATNGGAAVQPIAAVLLTSNQTASATANAVSLPGGTGSQSIDGTFAGDSNYRATTTGEADLGSPLGTPVVTVTASPNPAVSGATVTLTAKIVVSGNLPSGTVTFYDGSMLLGKGQVDSNAMATYSTNSLPVGSNSVSVSYDGGGSYSQTNSPAIVVTITAPGTTVPTVKATAASATIASAQTDVVTVTVAGAAGGPTPTGTISLNDTQGTDAQPLANGTASFTVHASTLSSGANNLTAAYSGDATYAAATGTVTITVSPVSIAVPAPSSVVPGASATATATLTAGSSYSGTMNLTCALTSSPTGAAAVALPTCSLAPTSVSLKAGGSSTSTVTVATTSGATASLRKSDKSLWGLGGGAALAALLMCGIPARRRRWMSMLVLLWIAVASLGLGCGGGGSMGGCCVANPGTTAGNYVFTIIGTDSATPTITTSTTVTVAVQ